MAEEEVHFKNGRENQFFLFHSIDLIIFLQRKQYKNGNCRRTSFFTINAEYRT